MAQGCGLWLDRRLGAEGEDRASRWPKGSVRDGKIVLTWEDRQMGRIAKPSRAILRALFILQSALRLAKVHFKSRQKRVTIPLT